MYLLLTMAFGKTFVKNAVFYLNVGYGLVGLVVEGIGFAMLVKWITTSDKPDPIGLMWLFYLVAGLVMALTGLFGCYATLRERKNMLIGYGVFILTVFVLQLALSVYLAWYSCVAEMILDSIFESIIRGGNSPASHHKKARNECHISPLEAVTGLIAYSFCVSFHDQSCSSSPEGLYERWHIPTSIVTIGVPLIEVISGCLALYLAIYFAKAEKRSYAALPETKDNKIPETKQALVVC